MKDYMMIIRGGNEELDAKPAEYFGEIMQKWNTWMGGLAEEGVLVGGQPLARAGKTIIEGGSKIIDRPLAEGKELVGGYVIIKADSLDAACEKFRTCPAVEHGSSLEVRLVTSPDDPNAMK